MTHCLLCKESISLQVTWRSLLLSSEQYTCNQCYEALSKINGSTCQICYRPQDNGEICPDCQEWEGNLEWKGILQKNVSVYIYNNAMKDILSTYKFRGDAALAQVFLKDFQACYKSNFSSKSIDISVPIPLSSERLYERGFNQAKLLADLLPLPQVEVLQRTHHEKQSKKSRQERLASVNVFSLTDPSIIIGKNILLIDDLYTTGSTLRHAAKLLKEKGASTVSAFTLIRS